MSLPTVLWWDVRRNKLLLKRRTEVREWGLGWIRLRCYERFGHNFVIDRIGTLDLRRRDLINLIPRQKNQIKRLNQSISFKAKRGSRGSRDVLDLFRIKIDSSLVSWRSKTANFSTLHNNSRPRGWMRDSNICERLTWLSPFAKLFQCLPRVSSSLHLIHDHVQILWSESHNYVYVPRF